MKVLEHNQLDNKARLAYLESFSSKAASEADRQATINGLAHCIDVPHRLSNWQMGIVREPFTTTRNLFRESGFVEICSFLQSNPKLVDLLRLLHEQNICEALCLEDYKCFTSDTEERLTLMRSVANYLGSDNTAEFLLFWGKNEYTMDELRRMECQARAYSDKGELPYLSNYGIYINLLYGSRTKTISLDGVRSWQEDILAYAIIHKKKRFVKLVEKNMDLFCALPQESFLLQENLYKEHFNLNELTEKDLRACVWMKKGKLDAGKLVPYRKYTFPELSALYGQSDVYLKFYHLLQSKSQDYRLRVFRQVRRQNALSDDMEMFLPLLTEKIDIKPLLAWKEQEFGCIAGLTMENSAWLLIYSDIVQHLLPEIRCQEDAVLVLKNRKLLNQFTSIDELKANIVACDLEWQALAEEMELSGEFLSRHQKTIAQFVCKNGAYIARTYENCLSEAQRQSFHRVVKAELMGRLCALKYFEGDLQRELNMPLSKQMQRSWCESLSIEKGDMKVQEFDDFFSTMQLGIQPRRTCMSYINGEYKECLLSAFDSNKKVVYALLRGRVVGRAFLRLTKGQRAGSSDRTEKTAFTFVDLEDIGSTRRADHSACEKVTLFLERPYIGCVNPDQAQMVEQMLIELASKKADSLGTMLVLSTKYTPMDDTFTRTLFEIYISKSKAGAQYLDSLGGEATVSEEGYYRTNSFFVREASPTQAV